MVDMHHPAKFHAFITFWNIWQHQSSLNCIFSALILLYVHSFQFLPYSFFIHFHFLHFPHLLLFVRCYWKIIFTSTPFLNQLSLFSTLLNLLLSLSCFLPSLVLWSVVFPSWKFPSKSLRSTFNHFPSKFDTYPEYSILSDKREAYTCLTCKNSDGS